jgi:hypothetical protein
MRRIAEILSDNFERVVVTKGARMLLRGGGGYSSVGVAPVHGSSQSRNPTRHHRSTLTNPPPARSSTLPAGGVDRERRPTKGGGVGEQRPVLTQVHELTRRTVRTLQEEQDVTRRAGRAAEAGGGDAGSIGRARGDADSLARAGTTLARGRLSSGTAAGLERLQQLYDEGEQRRQAETVSE